MRADGIWYTARVKVRLTFETGNTERGSARLLGVINGKPAALITLRAQPDGVRVFYDGYLTGPMIIVTKASTITVDYEKYPVTGAVISGANTFGITLEDDGKLVAKVAIDPLSGFAATVVPPRQLAIATPREISARVGERFIVPYEVTNRTERPDRPLRVLIEKAGGPLVLDDERNEYPTTGSKRTGQFAGVAADSGRYQLRLSANGGYNSASAIVVIDVRPGDSSAAGATRMVVAGALIALAAFAFLSGRRERSRNPNRGR